MDNSDLIEEKLLAEIVSKKDVLVKNILSWAEKNPQHFPWRQTEDPYYVLIAEILLQKTKADCVKKMYDEFIRDFPDIRSLANSKDSMIRERINPLGLGNTRTTRIKRIVSELCSLDSPEITEQNLEHVLRDGSPYLLNAFRCFAFGKPFAIFDVNIKRIFERVLGINLGTSAHRTRLAWKISELFLPEQNYKQYNWAMLDLGRQICLPRNPKCLACPIKDMCRYFRQQHLM